ncbi:MAG: flagellar biosynthesis protein FliP [Actinomycetota bacterium]|nr:flagellar biosynthesis protein FliP [Actinomycetota bacterium]
MLRRALSLPVLVGLAAGLLLVLAGPASAAGPSPSPSSTLPGIGVNLNTGDPGLSRTVVIVLLFGLASLAPAILLLMTSFTRFVVVLLLTRNALGLQGIPPNQVIIGLSLFLTLFAMGPVLSKVNHQAIQPALSGKIGWAEAAKKGYAPLQVYMERQVKIEDVALFTNVSGAPRPKTVADVPPRVLIPAFVLSELRRAFLIGFIVYVPFLVVDLVVASGLMSLGMVMLPPVVISLPLKLLLFVLVDGWGLLVRSLLMGAKGG